LKLKALERKNIEINPLLEKYSAYIKKINNVLDSELELYMESEFKEPLKYALDGGKRIRPIILLLSSECVGEIDDNTLAAACAIEFLHTESVIHDDIIDNETLRRQKDPFHIKYGYNISVLTGDFVLGLILNIASRINNPRVTKNLATTAMMMSEGEVIESRLEASEDVTFDDYLKVIEYKTATAFETASRLGAIISEGTEEEIESLADYGKNIGIAYQIRDDLLDWQNEDKLFNLLIKKSSDPRNVFNDMEELLKKYTDRAVFSIRKIKDSQAKNNLENLVRFTRTTV
jgi:octaprenyl-diphosphate synthase